MPPREKSPMAQGQSSWRWLCATLLLAATQQAGCMEHNVGGKTVADVFTDAAIRQLAQAACRGERKAVLSAVQAGANPNGTGLRGMTPLAWAVSCDSVAGVQALIAAGANPNQAIGDDFSSVVYLAVGRSDPAPLKALLDAGVDANVYDLKSERTGIGQALSRGIDTGDWRHWELMLGKVDINRPYNRLGNTIAVDAARLNQFERVVQLLESGYSYNLRGLGREVEVADHLTEPFAAWQRRALQLLEARGVKFPVGSTQANILPEQELQKLPANRR